MGEGLTADADSAVHAAMAEQVSLDRIDRRILMLLQADGKLTNQALSEQVALSPSACLARVRRLERLGVIQGYHARLDPFRLAGLVLFAEITLKAHGVDALARFDAVIGRIPQIVEASHVSGEHDYLLKVVVADLTEWTLIREQLTSEEAGADRINTHVLLRKPKIFVGYPVRSD
jgi:Lrp/AsnC family leucine-responsive transcriptional regulator